MQYCDNCKVTVSGCRQRCPLCQGTLRGEGEPQLECYPVIPWARRQHHLLIRSMVFLSIAAVVICAAVNFLFYRGKPWVLFVLLGVGSMWLSLSSVVLRRHNIPKNILWQVFWLSLLALVWDFMTGWHRWSIEYALPALFVFALAALHILARTLRLPAEDYMVYLVIDGLFGVIPILSILFGWVRVVYPSVVCAAASLLSLAALLTFQGETLLAELRKRLHL